MAKGRAWGNALGGWRLQFRGPGGKFGKKGARSIPKSSYKPSRRQLEAQALAAQQRKAKRNQRIKTAAKIGGATIAVAAVAGGAYYGHKSGVNWAQATQASRNPSSLKAANLQKRATRSFNSGAPISRSRPPAMAKTTSSTYRKARKPQRDWHKSNRVISSGAYAIPKASPPKYLRVNKAKAPNRVKSSNSNALVLRSSSTASKRSFAAQKGHWRKAAQRQASLKAAAKRNNIRRRRR